MRVRFISQLLPRAVIKAAGKYADQPKEGRFDGEDSNFGLVAEKDAPYQELTERMKKLAWSAYANLPWQ